MSAWTQAVVTAVVAVLFYQPVLVLAAGQTLPSGATRLTHSANGVPLIQIAPPDQRGVSHNRYQQFHVGDQGMVLNNATRQVDTAIAGQVGANPHLGTSGSARIIINEVTGAGRSSLTGLTEVAGGAAETIIANPWGIDCDGCGFINMPAATLTTGQPVFEAGAFEGLSVERGDIRIGRDGLDASTIDRLNLFARALQLDGAIHAKDLIVVSGAARINSAGVQSQASAHAKPQLGVDATALGAMHAGQITLIATEQGLGVNLGSAALSAANGALHINSAGELVLGDVAAQSLTVKADDDTSVTDTVYAAEHVHIESEGHLAIHSGAELAAGSSVDLSADDISIDGSLISGLNNRGISQADGLLSLTSNKGIQNRGVVHSGLTMLDAGTTIKNSGDIAARALIAESSGELDNRDGEWLVQDRALLRVDAVDNRGGTLAIGDDSIVAASSGIDNRGGLILIEGDNAEIAAGGAIQNTNGDLLHTGQGQLLLVVQSELDNSAGALASRGVLNISSDALNNNDGEILADTLALNSDVVSNRHGAVEANSAVLIAETSLDNRFGLLSSAQSDLHLSVGALDNSDGAIMAQRGALSVQGDALNNERGVVLAERELALMANDVSNQQGALIGNAGVSAILSNLNNQQGQISSGAHMSVIVDQAVDNRQGLVESAGALNIWSDTVQNQGGVISSQGLYENAQLLELLVNGALDNSGGVIHQQNGELLLLAASLNNSDGHIDQRGNGALAIQAAITNQSGRIQSEGDQWLVSTARLMNEQGALLSAGGLWIDSVEGVTNSDGLMQADGALMIASEQDLDNRNGFLRGADLMVVASDLNNQQGIAVADNEAYWDVQSAANNSGLLQAGALLDLAIANNGAVDGGVVDGGGHLVLRHDGDYINSAGTTLSSEGSLSLLVAGDVVNHGHIKAQGHLISAGETLVNTGRLNALVDVVLNFDRVDNRGDIQAGGNLQLQSQSLLNAGRMQAGGSGYLLVADSLYNNNGLISVEQNLLVAGDSSGVASNEFKNQSALMIAKNGHLAINAQQVINERHSFVTAGGEVRGDDIIAIDEANCVSGQCALAVSGSYRLYEKILADSPQSLLFAGGNMQIQAEQLDNRHSAIHADGRLDLLVDTITQLAWRPTAYVMDEQWQINTTQAGYDTLAAQLRAYHQQGVEQYTLSHPLSGGVWKYDSSINIAESKPFYDYFGFELETVFNDRALILPTLLRTSQAVISDRALLQAENGGGQPHSGFISANGAVHAAVGDWSILQHQSDDNQYRYWNGTGVGVSERRNLADVLLAPVSTGHALQSGSSVQALLSGDWHNEQSVAANDEFILSAEGAVHNLGAGDIEAASIDMSAGSHLVQASDLSANGELTMSSALDLMLNDAAEIVAGRSVDLRGDRVIVESDLIRSELDTRIAAARDVLVAHDSGELIDAGRDITVSAANDALFDSVYLKAGRAVKVESGGDINLNAEETVTHIESVCVVWCGEQISLTTTEYRPSSVKAGGLISLIAGQSLRLPGTSLRSDNRSLYLRGYSVSATPLIASRDELRTHYETKRTLTEEVIGTSLSAGTNIDIEADHHVLLQAAELNAGGDISISSGGDIELASAEAQSMWNDRVAKLRLRSEAVRTTPTELKAAGSVRLQSALDTHLTGTRVFAGGDVELDAGGNIRLAPALEQASLWSQYTGRKTSVTQTLETMTHSMAAIRAGGQLSVVAGDSIDIQATELTSGGDMSIRAGEHIRVADAQDVREHFYERRKSRKWGRRSLRTAESVTSTPIISELSAGGNLLIAAGTSDDAIGDLYLTGAAVTATGDILMRADGDVVLNTARDTYQAHSEHRANSGHGAYLSSANFNAKTKGSSDTHRVLSVATHIQAGGRLDIEARRNLILQAAQLRSEDDLSLSAVTGRLALLVATDIDSFSQHSESSSATWQSVNGRGHHRETHLMSQLQSNTDIQLIAQGVDLEIIGTEGQNLSKRQWLNAAIDQLASEDPNFEWMKQLKDQQDLHWEALVDIHNQWDYDQAGLTPEAAAVLAIATASAGMSFAAGIGKTAATAATKAGLVSSSTMINAVAGAATAATSAAMSSGVISLVNSQGNAIDALRDFISEDNLQSIAQSALTAGLLKGLDITSSVPGGEVDLNWQRLGEYTLATAVVDTAFGGSFEDHLINNLRAGLVNAAADAIAGEIGDNYRSSAGGWEDYLVHKLSHALLGCASGAALNDDCAGGAAGGVAAEVFAEWAYGDLNALDRLSKRDEGIALGRLVGAMAAWSVDGDISAGAFAGQNAVENNFNGGNLSERDLVPAHAMTGVDIGSDDIFAEVGRRLGQFLASDTAKEGVELMFDIAGVALTIGGTVACVGTIKCGLVMLAVQTSARISVGLATFDVVENVTGEHYVEVVLHQAGMEERLAESLVSNTSSAFSIVSYPLKRGGDFVLKSAQSKSHFWSGGHFSKSDDYGYMFTVTDGAYENAIEKESSE